MPRNLWMPRVSLLPILAVATVALAAVPVRAQDASAQLLKQVEGALKQQNAGAVHDLGHLLKPGGVRELEQQADRFKKEGINVYYVTLPKGSANVDRIAETAYRDLNGQPTDMLVVFDGQRVYGKTTALKGRKEAFQEAFREAQPGFKQYYAKGMAMFAEALRNRIKGKRSDADLPVPANTDTAPPPQMPSAPPAESPSGGVAEWLVPVGMGGILLTAGALAVRHTRRKVLDAHADRIQGAEQLYNRITLEMPDPAPDDLSREWLRLNEKYRRVKAGKARLVELVDLNTDLQELERRVNDFRRRNA